MKKNSPIYQWPRTQRPRERAIDSGISSLSDSELIALIIGKGTSEMSAVQLGEELVKRFGSLNSLSTRHPEDLKEVQGIGWAKALAIAAAFELGRRVSGVDFNDSQVVRSPEDVFAFMCPKIGHLTKETFWVILLTARGRIIRAVKISEGTLNSTVVHPRDVFKPAIVENAASVILVHNHPGGDPTPSVEDKEITSRIVQAGELFSIPVIDHVIITSSRYFSMRERGESLA